MARFQVSFDVNKAAYTKSQLAGATVGVRIPGTTVNIPDTIFADRSSLATLANPFALPASGAIDFYLAHSQKVDLVITPSGAPAQTQSGVNVTTPVPTMQPLMRNNLVVAWSFT